MILNCDLIPSSQLKLIQSTPQPCKRHKNNQIYFLCDTCIETQPLLCSQCIYAHKQHDWILYEKFFTEDVVELFRTGVSTKGAEVFKTVENIIERLRIYKQKIQERITKIQKKLQLDLQLLKQKFPVQGGYQIQGNNLDNRTMSAVMKIVRAQRNFYETNKLETVFKQIFRTSEMNLKQNFDRMQETLNDQKWQTFRKRDLEFVQNSYVKAFQKPVLKRDFVFSSLDKSKGVIIERDRTVAIYNSQYPPRPAILSDRFMNSQNNFVAFKVLKIPSTLKIIKNAQIYLGVCLYQKAQFFSFHSIQKPSHGSYMISSSGKSFHTKLPQYFDKNINFSFGVDDIISVLVDFEKRSVLFQKQTGVLFTRFEMPLDVDEKYMTNLRPCVMFDGELGAQVQIFTQEEYLYIVKKKKKGGILKKLNKK